MSINLQILILYFLSFIILYLENYLIILLSNYSCIKNYFMVTRHNTGSYRICKQQVGEVNTIEYLIDGDIDTVNDYWDNIDIENSNIIYYKEEQVVYRQNKYNQYNEIEESSPTWVRM